LATFNSVGRSEAGLGSFGIVQKFSIDIGALDRSDLVELRFGAGVVSDLQIGVS